MIIMDNPRTRRLKFKCWKCKREYSLLRDLRDLRPRFTEECPFCGFEGVIDLAPFRPPVVEIYQGAETKQPPLAETYALPDILPTADPAHTPL